MNNESINTPNIESKTCTNVFNNIKSHNNSINIAATRTLSQSTSSSTVSLPSSPSPSPSSPSPSSTPTSNKTGTIGNCDGNSRINASNKNKIEEQEQEDFCETTKISELQSENATTSTSIDQYLPNSITTATATERIITSPPSATVISTVPAIVSRLAGTIPVQNNSNNKEQIDYGVGIIIPDKTIVSMAGSTISEITTTTTSTKTTTTPVPISKPAASINEEKDKSLLQSNSSELLIADLGLAQSSATISEPASISTTSIIVGEKQKDQIEQKGKKDQEENIAPILKMVKREEGKRKKLKKKKVPEKKTEEKMCSQAALLFVEFEISEPNSDENKSSEKDFNSVQIKRRFSFEIGQSNDNNVSGIAVDFMGQNLTDTEEKSVTEQEDLEAKESIEEHYVLEEKKALEEKGTSEGKEAATDIEVSTQINGKIMKEVEKEETSEDEDITEESKIVYDKLVKIIKESISVMENEPSIKKNGTPLIIFNNFPKDHTMEVICVENDVGLNEKNANIETETETELVTTCINPCSGEKTEDKYKAKQDTERKEEKLEKTMKKDDPTNVVLYNNNILRSKLSTGYTVKSSVPTPFSPSTSTRVHNFLASHTESLPALIADSDTNDTDDCGFKQKLAILSFICDKINSVLAAHNLLDEDDIKDDDGTNIDTNNTCKTCEFIITPLHKEILRKLTRKELTIEVSSDFHLY